MKKIILAALTIIGLILFSNGKETSFKTIHVPRDKKTIQAAMDHAQAGDTIILAPGRYKEAVTFKSGVTLSGTDKKSCIISPVPGAAAVISAFNCKSGTIKNITIDGMDKKDNKIFSLGIVWNQQGHGDVIESVSENSPASRANIPVGAKFISINNNKSHHSLSYILAEGGKSSQVKLLLSIAGTHKTFTLITQRIDTTGYWPDGIVLLDSLMNVNNCIVSNCSGGGIISVGKTKSAITNNISNKNDCGIIVYSGATVSIRNNTCNENIHSGIFVFRKENIVEISKNICNKNKFNGIAVGNKGARAKIDKNICNKNKCGIYLYTGMSGRLSNNTCNENKTYGIAIGNKGTRAKVLKNICNKNKFGIYCYDGSYSTVADNICKENKREGIVISGKDTRAKIDKNICDKNQSGIFFSSEANGIVSNNRCNMNAFYGIIFSGRADGTIRGNTCNKNIFYGIALWDAGTEPRVINNICNDNKYGIYLHKGCKAPIDKRENSAKNNTKRNFRLN